MATIIGGGSGTTTRGTVENDTIYVRGEARGEGLGGDDSVLGDDAANALIGGIGADLIDARGGADFLDGGDGNDILLARSGDDLVYGGAGNDRIDGGSGRDRLRGGDGADRITAGDGDEVTAGSGDDSVTWRHRGQGDPEGVTTLDGGTGIDTLVVDKIDNWAIISGNRIGYVGIETTDTTVVSGTFAGFEHVRAGDGTEMWYVGSAADLTVTGAEGTDYLSSGSGDEVFRGGAGSDQYQFVWSPGRDLGHDVVLDFTPGEDSLASNYRDTDTGERILDVVQTETATGTRFQAYDDGDLVHVLDVVGVFDMPDDALYAGWGIWGPIA